MCSLLFSSILNYQPEPNVQLLIQKYIQLPAVYPTPAVYTAVFSTTSQIRMYSWLFSSLLNYQPEPNVQLVIQLYIHLSAVYSQPVVYQQYVLLPARAQLTAGYSALGLITNQSRVYS